MHRAAITGAANLGRALLAAGIVAAWLIPDWDLFLSLSMSAVSLLGLAGAFLIPRLPSHDGVGLRDVELLWSLVFLLHYAGHAFDLYGGVWYYDKLLHAGGGVLAALAAYRLAQATDFFWYGQHAPRRFRVFWIALSAAVVFGVVVELGEYLSDLVFGVGTQDHPLLQPIDDTMTDLLAETVTGALTGGALAWRTRTKPSKGKAPKQAARRRRASRD